MLLILFEKNRFNYTQKVKKCCFFMLLFLGSGVHTWIKLRSVYLGEICLIMISTFFAMEEYLESQR
jgi:hypothetical protein